MRPRARPRSRSRGDPEGAAAPPGEWGASRRWWLRHRDWLLLSAGMLLVTTLLTLLQPFPRIDRLLQDNARAAMGQESTDSIVIVAIDDASLEAVGRWPWRRAVHAELLRRIAAQAPRCIGMNLLLTETDGDDPADDAVLAQAIEDSGCVVLPMALQTEDGRPGRPLLPVQALADIAAGIGHAHLSLDADGVARSVYMREGFRGRTWLHFVSALFRAGEVWHANAPLPPHPTLPPPAGDLGPWLRSQNEMIIFTREERPFRQVSYIDVLRGAVPPDLFRDRYVLVGATARGMGDAYATAAPTKTALRPGVEIFAQVLQGKINGYRVVAANAWQDLAFNVLPLLVALLGLAWLRPLGILALIVSLLALRLGLHVARPYVGVQFAPAVGFMALLIVYPAWVAMRLTTALRYLRRTTAQINVDLDGFPPPMTPDGSGDFLDRQMAATSVAARRMRDVHRFVRDGIEYLPDPTLVLDAKAHVLIANRAALRHWRAEGRGLAGRDAHELLADLRARDNDRPMVPAGALRRSLAQRLGEGVDREGRILLVRCVPFFDTRNLHAGWMVALVDITRVRQAQSQRDEALRFISHDIREPSASILTTLELMRSRPDQATLDEMLERIRRHAQTGLELADGFVNVARAEVQPFKPEPLDLVALLHQAIDNAWAQARARHVRVQVLGGPEEALCAGDPGLLARALANVLSNALKYSPPGLDVRCGISERPRHWAVSIRDEGPGIPPELQSQLFRPFHRLHRETHPDVHGVGLGLLLVRTVVQRHGGAVEIDSAAHAGCTVTLLLPKPERSELLALQADLE